MRTERLARGRDEDPDALDAAATTAEREGDYELAVRFRFAPGWHDSSVVGSSCSAGRTRARSWQARMVRSPTFDLLAGELDGAYGGRAATAHDVDTARAGWPKIPDEARSSASTGGRS